MIRPIPPSKPADSQGEPESRVPILTEEVDSLQIFEDHDTLGDKRYPPVQRPPIFPRLFGPPGQPKES